MKPGPAIHLLIPLLLCGAAFGQTPPAEPASGPAQPAATDSPAPPKLTADEQKELDGLVEWQRGYYRSPEPDKLPAAFRRRAELGALSGGDQGWTEAAFVAEILKANPAKTAEWCRELANLPEPARGWWWTAVWTAQTPESQAAITEFAAKPEGDPTKIAYPWIGQKPSSILERQIRGTQQLAMLWAAFYASGNDAFLVKTFEVTVDPDLSDPKLSDRTKERRTNVTNAARHQLASAAHKDPVLMERLRTLAASAPEAQRAAVLAVLDAPVPAKPDTTPAATSPASDSK